MRFTGIGEEAGRESLARFGPQGPDLTPSPRSLAGGQAADRTVLAGPVPSTIFSGVLLTAPDPALPWPNNLHNSLHITA